VVLVFTGELRLDLPTALGVWIGGAVFVLAIGRLAHLAIGSLVDTRRRTS
jgi:hypothetical protein